MFIQKFLFISIALIFFFTSFVDAKNTNQFKLGADSDYRGGSKLRNIDKKLGEMGFARNGIPRSLGHTAEHGRRSFLAYREGDWKRSWAELGKGYQNLKNMGKVSQPGKGYFDK